VLPAAIRVLVVEDHGVTRRVLCEQLAAWRMIPTPADSGAAALEALDAAVTSGSPFGLVVMDAGMPGIDGFELAERIAQRPGTAPATVMMLTSTGPYSDAARCRRLGISSYLTKPVGGAALLDAIVGVLVAPALPSAAVPRAPEPAIVRRKVLLVEDNPVNQRVATGVLTKRGHDVRVTSNGHEALAALEQDTFDLVLMDVQMPEMNGYEATALIRAREQLTGRHVRVIAMTAHAMTGDRERCLAAGMDGYLSKPVDRLQLSAAVEHDDAGGRATAGEPAPIDLDALRGRTADHGAMIDTIRLFLEDCPDAMAAIKTAVGERDAEAIRLSAHTMARAAGLVSAVGLADAAHVLERVGGEGRLEAVEAGWRLVASEAAKAIVALQQLEPSYAARRA
jgi:two-component system, sensor histidine kinase and response regulator